MIRICFSGGGERLKILNPFSAHFKPYFSPKKYGQIPSGGNPPVKTYSQAKKLAKVWAEYAWLRIREESSFCYENQFQKAEQEKSEEDSERYYNPDMHGRKVVRMK